VVGGIEQDQLCAAGSAARVGGAAGRALNELAVQRNLCTLQYKVCAAATFAAANRILGQ
jgi:hypothetical protein